LGEKLNYQGGDHKRESGGPEDQSFPKDLEKKRYRESTKSDLTKRLLYRGRNPKKKRCGRVESENTDQDRNRISQQQQREISIPFGEVRGSVRIWETKIDGG